MNKIYTRINWENYPSEATALNETNLNKMDFALDEVDNRLIEQDTTKLSKTDASNDIVNWTMDEETGVITITRRSGEQILFDLNIEKIPVSFSLSDDGLLTMVTDDGTIFTANVGAMIPILTFSDSDEIAVSVSGTGINKTYSFSVKDNSITENKLQPNFLADIKVQSANASASAQSSASSANDSSTYATQSKSYAVGGTGGTRENEDTDNSKYYSEQAKQALSEMQKSQVTGVKGNNETEFRTGNVNLTSEDVGSVAVGGDVAENTVTYESSDVGPDEVPSLISLEKMSTGEKLSSLIKKTSIIANNFRYLLKLLGNTDISSIGDGTVTGAVNALNDSLLDKTYPVGSIYMSVNNVNPSTLFGGTWVAWGAGRVPVGVNNSDSNFSTVEKTGGTSTVTLTTEQMPKHEHELIRYNGESIYEVDQNTSTSNWIVYMSHGATTYQKLGQYKTSQVGSSSAHNNLQPYITCYMWKRTA